jgi:hypothetical protein
MLKALGGPDNGEAYGVCGGCESYAEVVAACDDCSIKLCNNCASTAEEHEALTGGTEGASCPSCLESASGTDYV